MFKLICSMGVKVKNQSFFELTILVQFLCQKILQYHNILSMWKSDTKISRVLFWQFHQYYFCKKIDNDADIFTNNIGGEFYSRNASYMVDHKGTLYAIVETKFITWRVCWRVSLVRLGERCSYILEIVVSKSWRVSFIRNKNQILDKV